MQKVNGRYIKHALLWALVLLAILISLLLSERFAIQKNTVVEDELAAMKLGDAELAYSYTSEDFQNETSRRSFDRFLAAYPVLKEHTEWKLVSREKIGLKREIVKGQLDAVSGKKLKIEFDLVNEHNQWKILSIHVIPVKSASITQASMEKIPPVLNQLYENKVSHFSIKYPDGWEVQTIGKGTVVFNGRPGTRSFDSSVNVQTVLTQQTGGDFSTVKQFVQDLKNQAIRETPDTRFLESGPVSLVDADGAKLKGEYLIFTYTYAGRQYKQWQVVVLRSDNQVFYAWAYTSLGKQYDLDLDIAKAMFSSWVIY